MNTELLQQEIQNLFSDFSIEIIPRELKGVSDFRYYLPNGTRVFIGYIPGTTPEEVAHAAKRLRLEGMIPVPHVPARRIKDEKALTHYLGLLKNEADVDTLLVIGGDPDPAEGNYETTLEVLKSGVLEKHNIEKIGIAFHPEGHPAVDKETLNTALRNKIEYGKNIDLDVFLISQFIVSGTPMIEWLEKLDPSMSHLPFIRVGLPGLVSSTKLFKFAQKCGVKASMTGLMKHTKTIKKLISVSTPAETVISLAAYNLAHNRNQIGSVHMSPFGAFERTAEWASCMARGDFQINASAKNKQLQLVG